MPCMLTPENLSMTPLKGLPAKLRFASIFLVSSFARDEDPLPLVAFSRLSKCFLREARNLRTSHVARCLVARIGYKKKQRTLKSALL